MGAISGLFNKIGIGFSEIFNSPQALYGLYLIAFFFGMFSLYRVLINKIPHLAGKPANVISFMITTISVGGIFYGKSYSQLIMLFNGFTGFLLLLFLSIGILAIGFFYASNKDGVKKWLILSFVIYVASSILVEPFKTYWGTTTGAAAVIFSIVETISEVSLVVFIITLIMFIYSLFSDSQKDEMLKTVGDNKEINEYRNLIRIVKDETKKIEEYFNYINKILTPIVKDQNQVLNGNFQDDEFRKIVDLNNKINISSEKITDLIKKCQNIETIDKKYISSIFFSEITDLPNKAQMGTIYDSLNSNHNKILNLIENKNDQDISLNEIIKRENSLIYQYLSSNAKDRNNKNKTNFIQTLINSYNVPKQRIWEQLRTLLGQNDTYSSEFLNMPLRENVNKRKNIKPVKKTIDNSKTKIEPTIK